jgi:hypothetical protein
MISVTGLSLVERTIPLPYHPVKPP